MRRRQVYALAGLIALFALGGCLGGGSISEDDLTQNATYDWDTNATATYNLTDSAYTAVFELENRTDLVAYARSFIGTENPVELRALQFRFPNGTVVDASHGNLTAEVEDDRAHVMVPAENGSVAFTADRSGKSFGTRVFVEGSHVVKLPATARIDIPLMASVQPGGYEQEMVDGRVHVRWDDLTASSFRVRYYLVRDLLIFGGLVAIAVTVGAGGLLYYWRQIRRAKRKRQEVGLDVETDSDDDPRDDGPPPGMR